MSTTPAAPGCRPWPQEVLEPTPPGLLAGAPVATPVAGWLAATVPLLPEEPHPAMVSVTAASSAIPETAAVVLDI
jgi:hypothetical protein